MNKKDSKLVLVLGATGYVGARLVPLLLQAGYRVRAAARSVEKLEGRSFSHDANAELFSTDILDIESLKKAVQGCGTVFYLVHSMQPGITDYEDADKKAALNMVTAAESGGAERIIYLGGLGDFTLGLSKHLRSRAEVGEILMSGAVPATVLRAAMIIGSGSASFEIMRYLVDRLPVMVTPRWVRTPAQPIAIRNVLFYLMGCLENDMTAGETFDIGGPEVLTYRDLFAIYAEEAGLAKRFVIPVPVLTPRLSSYWIHFVTPVDSSIARPLAEGLATPVYCKDNRIKQIIPQRLLSCRESIRYALQRVQKHDIESSWTDAGSMHIPEWADRGDARYAGGTILESTNTVVLNAAPDAAWKVVRRIGGEYGWYYGNWLWKLRGGLDRLAGGVGMRRGRRHPDELHPGDALDFLRILTVEERRRLRLAAEMKLPGEAILEFLIEPVGQNRIRLTQRAQFLPRGLFGIVYWYALYVFHIALFSGMQKRMADSIINVSGDAQ